MPEPKVYWHKHYQDLLSDDLSDCIDIIDHIDGFDAHGENPWLRAINERSRQAGKKIQVNLVYWVPPHVRRLYPNIDIRFKFDWQRENVWDPWLIHNAVPRHELVRSHSCFNGACHVGRMLLTAYLHKQNMWNDACSKNFTYTNQQLDGTISMLSTKARYHRKFFVHHDGDSFYGQTFRINRPVYSFWIDHQHNFEVLHELVSSSFVNIVSETLATNALPFITEKFLLPVLTETLFVAYAPRGWHQHLRDCYGFRLYDEIFDYSFDSIDDPIERLLAMFRMLSPFMNLDPTDWQDLREMNQHTLTFNRQHFLSQEYRNIVDAWQDYR